MAYGRSEGTVRQLGFSFETEVDGDARHHAEAIAEVAQARLGQG